MLFLTTNHPERLDPALLRPGRVDRKIELGLCHARPGTPAVSVVLSGMRLERFRAFSRGRSVRGAVPTGKLGMAAIQEHLLRHRRSPEAAAHEVLFDEIVAETARLISCGTEPLFPAQIPVPKL